MKKFMILLAVLSLALLTPAVLQAPVAFAGSDSPFEAFMKKRRLKIQHFVKYDNFVKNAMANAMLEADVQGLFVMLEIKIKGEGEERYMLGKDLITGCGAECDQNEGMGVLLVRYLSPADLDR